MNLHKNHKMFTSNKIKKKKVLASVPKDDDGAQCGP